MVFCRLGGLSPVKHKNKNDKFTFHFPPPIRKGIYAFIWPYIELFLVMWRDQNERELKINGFRKFKYDGPIWCHHETDKILGQKGSWYLTDTHDLEKKLLKKDWKESRHQAMGDNVYFIRDPYKRGSSDSITISRDHLEVYIEKKYLGRIR